MDITPERQSRHEGAHFTIAADENRSPRRSSRIKKPPPITPRRFTRFFTPRLRDTKCAVKTSRYALREVSGTSLNSRQQPASFVTSSHDPTQPNYSKKRKLSFSSLISSIPSSPVRNVPFLSSSQERPFQDDGVDERNDTGYLSSDECSTEFEDDSLDGEDLRLWTQATVNRYPAINTSTNLLSRRLLGQRTTREPRRSDLWQTETADFYSSSNDLNTDHGPETSFQPLPFCATSCKTNPLVAVGDEEGGVRLIDSAEDSKDGFSKTYLTMKPHDNAVMDLEFSNDDAYLATASGDQTCHIIDMQSQTSICCLTSHTSSIKKIQFQPGAGNSVLATCARDGCINLWDLRCSNSGRSMFRRLGVGNVPNTQSMRDILPRNSIRNAHPPPARIQRTGGKSRNFHLSGRNDFSVTSLSFLDESRPHFLVTASESDAVVKLWDMRTTYSSRRGKTIPVSCTQAPKSHDLHRPFGVTSLAVNSDGSKFYTLCRDNTVYAYSTSHLILSDAPEMSIRCSSKPFRPGEEPKRGLGPLYGFRHPSLRVLTFYPKLAIRKSNDTNTEILAIGSSDDCAVLFPTHDRYLTKSAMSPPPPLPQRDRGLVRTDSQSTSAHITRNFDDDIPIYYHGTPLIRGHNKEVTAVSWTSEGNLITSSDDFSTRCWRQDRERARDLRMKGELEGRRWMAGWAHVAVPGYDDDED